MTIAHVRQNTVTGKFQRHEEGSARLFFLKALHVIYSTVGSVTMQETWCSTNLALL